MFFIASIFILSFLIAFIYFFCVGRYDLAALSLLMFVYVYHIKHNNNSSVEKFTSEQSAMLNNLLNNGTLNANYLTVNNQANLCGVAISDGKINVPTYASLGQTEFMNGGISTQSFNIA